jgi:hypothetical protein
MIPRSRPCEHQREGIGEVVQLVARETWRQLEVEQVAELDRFGMAFITHCLLP